MTFDAQCDLAALVYERHENPDALLSAFSADLIRDGARVAGLVQLGQHCTDQRQLSARLIHSGEELGLFQDLGSCAQGCRLDVGRLLEAGAKIAGAIDRGADLVIVNRFGQQECEGKGLTDVIDRALSADIPVLIAVPAKRFADWIRFSDGMSVKLHCDRHSLDAWWHAVSRLTGYVGPAHTSVCEVLK